jgi:hypothetical protein
MLAGCMYLLLCCRWLRGAGGDSLAATTSAAGAAAAVHNEHVESVECLSTSLLLMLQALPAQQLAAARRAAAVTTAIGAVSPTAAGRAAAAAAAEMAESPAELLELQMALLELLPALCKACALSVRQQQDAAVNGELAACGQGSVVQQQAKQAYVAVLLQLLIEILRHQLPPESWHAPVSRHLDLVPMLKAVAARANSLGPLPLPPAAGAAAMGSTAGGYSSSDAAAAAAAAVGVTDISVLELLQVRLWLRGKLVLTQPSEHTPSSSSYWALCCALQLLHKAFGSVDGDILTAFACAVLQAVAEVHEGALQLWQQGALPVLIDFCRQLLHEPNQSGLLGAAALCYVGPDASRLSSPGPASLAAADVPLQSAVTVSTVGAYCSASIGSDGSSSSGDSGLIWSPRHQQWCLLLSLWRSVLGQLSRVIHVGQFAMEFLTAAEPRLHLAVQLLSSSYHAANSSSSSSRSAQAASEADHDATSRALVLAMTGFTPDGLKPGAGRGSGSQSVLLTLSNILEAERSLWLLKFMVQARGDWELQRPGSLASFRAAAASFIEFVAAPSTDR